MDSDARAEYQACLALRHAEGLGARTWKRLLDAYGSAAAAVVQAADWPCRKLTSEAQAAVFASGEWRAGAEQEERRIAGSGCGVLLYVDEAYPALLREIPDPPLVLYHQGDASLLGNPGVAVVGSRQCSRQGRDITASLARGLSEAGVTVVSGMAWGIDREAHVAALQGVGRTIAVLGTGMDLVYPKDNRDIWQALACDGLLLTEFGPGTRPLAGNFPRRNRIISGLCLAVVVVEASEKSGALITAQFALEQNREVFSVPGPPGLPSFEGCRRLVQEGAREVHYAEEVLLDLAPLLRSRCYPVRKAGVAPAAPDTGVPSIPLARKEPVAIPADILAGLTPDEAALMAVLAGGTMHIDAVGRSLGWDAAKVSRSLLSLEMQGAVVQLPGMRYHRA